MTNLTASDALAAQIAAEKAEIENAPKILLSQLMPNTGKSGRCCKCGQVSGNLLYMDTVHGQERWVGYECCGGRHA